jgi:hypothetical protein
LKAEAYRRLVAFIEGLGEAFRTSFAKACPEPSPNQEQEQEQEQDQDLNSFPQTSFAESNEVPSREGKQSKPTEAQTEHLYTLYPRKRDKLDGKKADSESGWHGNGR